MSSPFTGSGWYSIPSHRPFVLDLAQGLYDALAHLGPQALSQAVVLTPTRRGARALADAFVTVSGGRAILPPQIRPLGDLDEGEAPFEPGDLAIDLPASIGSLRRRFELVGLVKRHEAALGRDLDAPTALEFADALGGFLDSLQIEEVSATAGLADLVTADMAEHWRISREFLEMALESWPRRLAELGLMDISARRVALLHALAEKWDREPPQGVLVAAGSTGTAKATADLLRVVARAPQGAVVLPGLDHELSDKAWKSVEEQHPQGAMKRLIESAGLVRDDVAAWIGSPPSAGHGRWRRRVINEALRPAEQTADWITVINDLRRESEGDPVAEGLAGLSLVCARTEDEAATVAALLLREALETPGQTAALVSPDQALARRVSAKLARWGVSADSSAGLSLAGCSVGVLADLVVQTLIDPLDPVRLLAILKHPLVRLGLDAETREASREQLERYGLRGARAPDWDKLAARLSTNMAKDKLDPAAALALLNRLRAILPQTGPEDQTAATLARTMAEALEAMARAADGSSDHLWSGLGGEALSRLLAGLMEDSAALPAVTPRSFNELFRKLVAGETVRAGGASHPRLRILGAIEARLIRADRLIVAGLEEGVWPQGAPVDPFLSRPMRKTLGLPPPERRIGLAAHDFAQAACAPDVVLLHTERREGAPAIKSRWLWRLETLARGAGLKIAGRPEILDWARGLDDPGKYEPAPRPAPVPPVGARPRRMAVTRVEALTRDPYSVWARDILRLYPLERPDEAVDVRARGSAIHKAFEDFVRKYPSDLPADAAARFEGFYIQALVDQGMPPDAMVREHALAQEMAKWVVGFEQERRADGRTIHVERAGELSMPWPGGAFVLTAKSDRIEIGPDGRSHILDYKTGSPPSEKQVKTGFSPQLTLTAAILAGGGFGDLGRPPPGELLYVKVTGRRPAGEVVARCEKDGGPEAAAEKAMSGLAELIAQYDDPLRGYPSRTAPQFAKGYPGDYDHLARVFEWSTSGEEPEE